MHPRNIHIDQALKLYDLFRQIANIVYDEREGLSPSKKEYYTSQNLLSTLNKVNINTEIKIEFLLKKELGQIDTECLNTFHLFFKDNECLFEKYNEFEPYFIKNGVTARKMKWRKDTYVLVYLFDKFWNKTVYSKKGLYGMLMENFLDKKGKVLKYGDLRSLLNKYKKVILNYDRCLIKNKKPSIIYWRELADKLLSTLLQIN